MKATEDVFRKMHRWLADQPEAQSEQEIQAQVDEFMALYNSGEIESNSIDDFYDLLDEADVATTKAQKKKLLKQALAIDPDSADAQLYLIRVESDGDFRVAEPQLRALAQNEKRNLEKRGIFCKESVGDFYMIFDTRPFMRVQHSLLIGYISIEEYAKARDIAEEMLRLNRNDNQGARYILLGLYAEAQDSAAMARLVKKFPHDGGSLWYLPQLIMAYKLQDKTVGQKLIRMMRKENKYVIEYLRGKQKITAYDRAFAEFEGAYGYGSRNEAIFAIGDNDFAISDPKKFGRWVDGIAASRARL